MIILIGGVGIIISFLSLFITQTILKWIVITISILLVVFIIAMVIKGKYKSLLKSLYILFANCLGVVLMFLNLNNKLDSRLFFLLVVMFLLIFALIELLTGKWKDREG